MIKELGFLYINIDPTVPPGVPVAIPNVIAIRNDGSIYTWVGPTSTDWIILPIRQIIDDFSAGGSPLLTEETISGFRAVAISPSGNLRIAMPAVSGRMPAVGVTISGALSGTACSFWTDGFFQVSSGLGDFSGFIGQPVYGARSGQLAVLSGGILSGGFASGDVPQRMGSVVNSGGIRLRLDPFTKDAVQSPPGTSWILSGDVASGQISQAHLSSGAVSSGQVASGAVLGSLGGGARTIASGTIGPNDLGSGAVLSGAIASGQVGQFAIASGSVTSGHLGVTGAPDGTKFLRDDFSWALLGSGVVSSGDIASGAVQGFFGTTRNIASGTVGVLDFGSGAVVAGSVGSGAVTSGNIASGQVGQFHLASGAVAADAIASGQVSQFKLSSGAVNSGQVASGAVLGSLGGGGLTIASGTVGPNDLGSGAVLSGAIASGQVGNFSLASGAVTSGRLGVTGVPDGTKFLRDDFSWSLLGSGVVSSGDIASGAVQGFFGTTRNIASGTVGVFDFGSGAVVAGAVGSGAVVSGNIASGQVGQAHLASGTVTSGAIASGQVSQFKLASGAINSGQVASGAVIGMFGGGALTIASGTIGPNDLGSGAVASGHTASGAVITYARDVVTDLFTCTEAISGVRCVTFDPAGSGQIRVAMAAVSGRMPAIGVVFENNASGGTCKVVQAGHVIPPGTEMGSGVCISGRVGKSLWVGASGQLVVLSGGGPQIGVGTTNSGAWGQRMGTSALSGTVLVQMNPNMQFSGAANITTNPQQWPV